MFYVSSVADDRWMDRWMVGQIDGPTDGEQFIDMDRYWLLKFIF